VFFSTADLLNLEVDLLLYDTTSSYFEMEDDDLERAERAERWEAFRRYLTDFPRLHEAPPATLELWERYLVYGIAFGIAERVLQGAQLHMPEALHQASSYAGSPPVATSARCGKPLDRDLRRIRLGTLAPPNSGSGGVAAVLRRRWRRRRWRRRRDG
jgi:hypothetical protein